MNIFPVRWIERIGWPTIATAPFCPGEVQGEIALPRFGTFWRRIAAAAGPGLLVAIGYMDPGNWATDIEAGSRLGTDLLFVVMCSGLAAILFQTLAARLGLAGYDLAQGCRARYPGPVRFVLWILAELAIVATDIAEVLGAALALKLLFGLPLAWGIVMATLDIFLVLGLQGAGFRRVEAIILGLIAIIGTSLIINLVLSPPELAAIAAGLTPSFAKLEQPHALYLALGIVGATIMPHNLYLHSSIVQTRKVEPGGERAALALNTFDTIVALLMAMAVNGAILVLASSAFHANGQTTVASIEDAHHLLAPATGVVLSGAIFAIGLLASGLSATFTGTIAGQVILEGFLDIRIPCWQRRIISRGLAIVPALIGVMWLGDGGVGPLLVLSQVVLAGQLPFALYPLIRLTADKRMMGPLTAPHLLIAVAWVLFAILTAADIWLVTNLVAG
jgi:manganese transport protein